MTATRKTAQKKNYITKPKAEKLRQKLNILIEEKGVRNAHISRQANIYGQTITRFRKGEKTLTKETGKRLEAVLKDYDI